MIKDIFTGANMDYDAAAFSSGGSGHTNPFRYVMNNATSSNYTVTVTSSSSGGGTGNFCCGGGSGGDPNYSTSLDSNFQSYAEQQALYAHITWFQYVAWGIAGNTIAVFGLIGNFLSVIVLANRRMKSSTSCYLIALAFFDSVVLLALVLFLALPTISYQTGQIAGYTKLYPYMQPYAYPTALTAQTCSIYTTVAFTVERYIAVCWPLKAAKMCTISRSRKAVGFIVICSIIYNIPRMLEYKVVETWDPVTNETKVTYDQTSLGKSNTYQHVYFIYMQLVVMLLVPFITLAVLNYMLIKAVRQSEHAKGKVNNKARRENSLTIMLISVIFVFLICQVPSIVDNILMATVPREVLNTAPFIKLTCISSLMVITNSAVNFYLYCVFGRKFRRVFVRLFCWCLPPTQRYLESETSLLHAPSMRNTSSMRHAHNGGCYAQQSLRATNSSGSGRSEKDAIINSSSGLSTPRLNHHSVGARLQMSVYENGKTKTSVCGPGGDSHSHTPYSRMDSTQSQSSQL